MVEKDRILPSDKNYIEFPVQDFLKQIKEDGFKKAEIWAAVPCIFVDAYGCGSLEYLKKTFEKAGVQIVCYRPAPYGYALYAEKNSFFRRSSLEYYYSSIKAAEELNASIVAIEVSFGPLDQNEELKRELVADGIRKIGEQCWNKNMRLVWKINPYPAKSITYWLEETKILYEMLGNCKDKVGLEMDLNWFGKSRKEVSNWFKAFGKSIWYISGIHEERLLVEEVESLGYSGFYGQDYLKRRIMG